MSTKHLTKSASLPFTYLMCIISNQGLDYAVQWFPNDMKAEDGLHRFLNLFKFSASYVSQKPASIIICVQVLLPI